MTPGYDSPPSGHPDGPLDIPTGIRVDAAIAAEQTACDYGVARLALAARLGRLGQQSE